MTRGWRHFRVARGSLGLIWRVYLTAALLLLGLLGTTVALARQPPPPLPAAVVIDSPEEPQQPRLPSRVRQQPRLRR
ncbi:MAG: hypothetical protein U0232_13360 [Thermomicrobiales bacterium]